MPLYRVGRNVSTVEYYTVESRNREEAILSVLNGNGEIEETNTECSDFNYSIGSDIEDLGVSIDGVLSRHFSGVPRIGRCFIPSVDFIEEISEDEEY